LFVKLVNEKAKGGTTTHLAILVEKTHDDTRATLFVFYPEFGVGKFVPRIPSLENSYIDDDGKHGEHWESFPEPTDVPEDVSNYGIPESGF
jgi:hypothetical protein